MGSISYWFLGTAEAQKWGKFEVDDSTADGVTVIAEKSDERCNTKDKDRSSQ